MDSPFMHVRTKLYGRVSIMVTHGGLPALRLLAAHSPLQRIEVKDEKGENHLLPLSEIDITHETVMNENRPTVNVDRAQLAKLGASNYQHAHAAAPQGEERARY